jgi:hypothetical protein
MGFTLTAGLGELGKRVVEGKAKLNDQKDLLECLGKYTPGARWNSTSYTDLSTGIRSANQRLVYLDTYVFGRGYLGTTRVEIPRRFRTISR